MPTTTRYLIPALALCSLSTTLAANTLRTIDTDADGFDDNIDNCTLISNPDQRDTNGDLYGNACDPDLDNDGSVNFIDLGLLKSVFFETGNVDEDLDGDGAVNFIDLGIMKSSFFQPPGPSGAATGAIEITATSAFPTLSFTDAVALMQAPGDGSRWYVVEQRGTIRTFPDQADPGTPATFVNIIDRAEPGSESGLLGLAFHPNFPDDPRVYLSYTRDGPSLAIPLISYVSEFTSPDGGMSLDPDSEVPIITAEQPFTNHNGGNILFSPDGLLYIGLGDGGSGGDPRNNGQKTNTLLGAMLRIDIDVSAEDRDAGITYYIPPGNPFEQSAGCGDETDCPELYAWGLRNPWRWSFDRETGQLWLGDVGQSSFEEVDIIENGGNYGWRCYEADSAHNLNGCLDPSNYIFPVASYPRTLGFSITGGYVYRGSAMPALNGVYLYADYGTGRIWGLDAATLKPLGAGELLDTSFSISSFGENVNGELYFLDYGSNGRIYRIDQAN